MIVIKIFFLKIKIKPFSMVEETNYHNLCHNPIFNLSTQVCKIIHMTIQKIQRDINSSIVPNQQIMKWVANILLCSTYNTKNFVNLIWCILVLVLWVIWRLDQDALPRRLVWNKNNAWLFMTIVIAVFIVKFFSSEKIPQYSYLPFLIHAVS